MTTTTTTMTEKRKKSTKEREIKIKGEKEKDDDGDDRQCPERRRQQVKGKYFWSTQFSQRPKKRHSHAAHAYTYGAHVRTHTRALPQLQPTPKFVHVTSPAQPSPAQPGPSARLRSTSGACSDAGPQSEIRERVYNVETSK